MIRLAIEVAAPWTKLPAEPTRPDNLSIGFRAAAFFAAGRRAEVLFVLVIVVAMIHRKRIFMSGLPPSLRRFPSLGADAQFPLTFFPETAYFAVLTGYRDDGVQDCPAPVPQTA